MTDPHRSERRQIEQKRWGRVIFGPNCFFRYYIGLLKEEEKEEKIMKNKLVFASFHSLLMTQRAA